MSMLLSGERTRPPLKFTESSGFSGWAPRACAIGLSTRAVRTSNGWKTPLTFRKFVETVEKYDWPSEGARKPVEPAPRATSHFASS